MAEVKIEEIKPLEGATGGAVSQPVVVEGATGTSAAAPIVGATGPTSPPPPPTPVRDWREDRIAKLTAQLHSAKEALEAAKATTQQATGLTQADVERLANEKAVELAATQKFNADCDQAAKLGRSEFPDFEARIGELRRLVTAGDPTSQAAQVAMVQAALQTGQAHRVLHRLGGDLNEAARIMSLSPVAMAVEVAKLATEPSVVDPKPLPKPITPVGARGAVHTDISPDDPERGGTLTMAEWMRRREAQVQERWKARGR